MQTRFIDEGRGLASFMGEISVKCPKCENRSIVREGVYFCSHCDYHPTPPSVLQYNCERCQKPLYPLKGKFNGVVCVGCGHSNTLESQESNLGVDPYYGIDLWFSTSYRGNILWFYNREHLEYVESYLMADIRERSQNAGNGSLISRLPAWIKLAKSKAGVLKKLTQMKIANQKNG